MAKKLLHDYTFDASAKQVVLQGVYKRERLLMVSNVTCLGYQTNITRASINTTQG